MLKLENIHKPFHAGTVNQKIALDGLSLTLNDGDFVTVIGGNGAGKSTLLNTIAGTFPVDSGTITIDGEDITDLSEEKRARFLKDLIDICKDVGGKDYPVLVKYTPDHYV